MEIKIIERAFEYQINQDYSTMPQIIGTEKQVSWAEDIRSSRVREVNKIINDTAEKLSADLDKLNEIMATQGMAEALVKLLSNTDAKFWIETRKEPIQSVLTK